MKHAVIAMFVTLVFPLAARAEPVLQVYVEGSTYDAATESWIIPGPTFRLWVIGNTGWKGTIYDVKIALAFDGSETIGGTITPSTTGGYGGFTDPSTPASPSFVQLSTDGSSPLLGDGSPLPTHGIYGPGVHWVELLLGDFSLVDSPIGDFITSFPSPSSTNKAQINVYDITVTGVSGVHIDAYNHVIGNPHAYYKFAPFSHDAGGGGNGVPEPASLLLLGAAFAGVALARRRRRRA